MTVRRALLIVAVNIAVLGVVAEVAGLAVFYSQHGWLFYLDPYRPAYPPIALDEHRAFEVWGVVRHTIRRLV